MKRIDPEEFIASIEEHLLDRGTLDLAMFRRILDNLAMPLTIRQQRKLYLIVDGVERWWWYEAGEYSRPAELCDLLLELRETLERSLGREL